MKRLNIYKHNSALETIARWLSGASYNDSHKLNDAFLMVYEGLQKNISKS